LRVSAFSSIKKEEIKNIFKLICKLPFFNMAGTAWHASLKKSVYLGDKHVTIENKYKIYCM